MVTLPAKRAEQVLPELSMIRDLPVHVKTAPSLPTQLRQENFYVTQYLYQAKMHLMDVYCCCWNCCLF